MNVGYIYITTNDINENIYIGKRQKPTFEKWYKGSGTHLKSAFKRYGKSHFHASVLEWCDSKESLCNAERRWIKHFRDNEVPMYNIASGGDGGNNVNWSSLSVERRIEINQKNSDAHKGDKNGFFGKKHSEESKKLISEHNARRFPIELVAYKVNQRSALPKIAQFDKKTGKLLAIWDNWCEASRSVSPNNRCGYGHIMENCQHKRKSAYGFRWEYAETGWTI